MDKSVHVNCLQHVKAISVLKFELATFVLVLLKTLTSNFTYHLYVGIKLYAMQICVKTQD